MMLVGDIKDRTAILIDDLADTSNTITRAAKLLKKEGASKVYALVTHGIFSGDAIDRINASALDKVVVTNTVSQEINLKRCPKLEVLEVGQVFAEVFLNILSQIRNNLFDEAVRFLVYYSLILSDYRQSVVFTMVKVLVFYSNMTEQKGI